MKKLLLLLTLAFTITTNAQDEKTKENTIGFVNGMEWHTNFDSKEATTMVFIKEIKKD